MSATARKMITELKLSGQFTYPTTLPAGYQVTMPGEALVSPHAPDLERLIDDLIIDAAFANLYARGVLHNGLLYLTREAHYSDMDSALNAGRDFRQAYVWDLAEDLPVTVQNETTGVTS